MGDKIMSEHIVPVRIYVTIFLVLLVGTLLTVWAAFQDFPWQLNTIVALTIAITKATFVVLYFMHVRYSARLTWVILASALFWMGILFALTFSLCLPETTDARRRGALLLGREEPRG